jgi:hypothetical protein
MNQKKAKELRRAVRFEGLDPRAVKPVLIGAQFIPGKPSLVPGLTLATPGCHFLGQRSLDPSCGRSIYQQYKKEAA